MAFLQREICWHKRCRVFCILRENYTEKVGESLGFIKDVSACSCVVFVKVITWQACGDFRRSL